MTIKINSSDFVYSGLKEEESLTICKLLVDARIDSIEGSGNGTSVRGIKAGINEGYLQTSRLGTVLNGVLFPRKKI